MNVGSKVQITTKWSERHQKRSIHNNKVYHSMKTLAGIFLLVVTVTARDCKMLPDGHYSLNFASKQEERFHVKVNGDTYAQYSENGDSINARIQSISNCTFKLNYSGQRMAGTINNLKQQLHKSFGEQCIEIQKVDGDSIKFRITYTGNLHVTVDEGYYVKR
jgi:hypothetical protein